MAPRTSASQRQSSWQKSTIRSSWQKSTIRCMGFAALIYTYTSCSMSAIFVVEAKKPMGSSSAAARSSLPPTLRNHRHFGALADNNVLRPTTSRWVGGSAYVPAFLQLRASLTVPTSRTLQRDAAMSIYKGYHDITKIRGGSSEEEEEDEEEEEEYDEDEEEEYDDSEMDETDESDVEEEYDSDEEEEEDEDEAVISQSSLKSSILSKSQDSSDSNSEEIVEYDELIVPPAMQQFGISIGVMMLSNRIDILNAKAVQIARYAFLTYIISVQVFLLYVRFRAKSINNRTSIKISNPLAALVPNGASSDGANFMVKALADQVLSTQTTVLEYDLKEVKKMNGGLLVPMVFLYFLHFKMKQVQPLLMQTATGLLNLVYSPLFQVYVMGKNLERPFKPPVNPMLEAMQAKEEPEEHVENVDGQKEGDAESVVSTEDDGDEESENEGEDEVSEASEEEKEEDGDEDSEYDDSDE